MRSRLNLPSFARIGNLRFGAVVAVLLALGIGTDRAQAQLRIVSYNTTGAPYTGMDIVLRSIGEEERNGIAKPIDVLLLQETSRASGLPDTQAFVDLLNTMYAGQTFMGQPITYSRGTLIGNASFSGDSGQSIVFRDQTVKLIAESAVGFVSGSGQARQAMRYRLQPVGYNTLAAEFYAYNAHFKAGTEDMDPNNPIRRNIEAVNIRNNANQLGNAHIIYAGDFNLYTSAETAFQTLIAAGNGQAFDPIDRIGDWGNNSDFADVHTQAPCSSSVSNCGSGGGMDDRFDFQLVTNEFLDGEGLDYIPGSYRAFGNNGVSFNTNINNAANTNVVTGYPFNGVASHTRTSILGALRTVTDHIPVVVDYQVPAIMQAVLSTVPGTLNVGDIFNVDVTVSNIANVVAAIGADELDYSITTALGGAVSGSYFDQVTMALSAGNVHSLLLDTSTAGSKTGTIMVQSSSQGVQNAFYEFPISYEVLAAALYGDYNNDGTVDAADYTLWRNALGSAGDALANRDPNVEGDVGVDDYDVWKLNYGQSLSGSGGLAGLPVHAVPEPAAWMLLLVSGCLCRVRGGTLRAWNRAT